MLLVSAEFVCLGVFLTLTFLLYFSREIVLAAQALLLIPTHFSVAWSVCVSSVNLPLLKITDLDVIWQVDFWNPMTHCVWCRVFDTPGRRDLRSNPRQRKHTIAIMQPKVSFMLPSDK